MANYTFTTEQDWRVTEYRPFSLSYSVLHTPGLLAYSTPLPYGNAREDSRPATENDPSARGTNLLASLTSQQLKFSYLSFDVLRQLLQERVNIRDRNRSSVLGRLTDVSGEIYGCRIVSTPENDRRRQGFEKARLDLEREIGEIDERLWKDTAEIRERLIAADKQYASTRLRAGLLAQSAPHDDDKGQDHPTVSG
jgi:hypothetical protein